MASQRDGSPIVLPRAKDEMVMLAHDRRNGRLVELHVVTGEAAPQPVTDEPALRRWIKPASQQLRRKQAPSQRRAYSRFSSRTSGRRRLVQSARARYLHRFYQPKSFLEPAAVASPKIMGTELQSKIRERLREAARIQSPSFMSVIESGMDDDMPYYITHLNDGEFVQDYIRRRGALPTATSLALVKRLLKDLSAAAEDAALPSTLRLERVLVTSQEEEYLQLRVFDYGLSHQDASTTLVHDLCHLLFLLLTGQRYAGGNPENFGVIAELPSALRFLLKQVLTKHADTSVTLRTLRTEVREALCSLVTLVLARNPRMLLAADDASLPISHLQNLLLENTPLKTLFGASFQIENPELAGCHPFSIPAVNVCGTQDVTLQLLPPERIVSKSDFASLPSQAWRQDPARHVNLLPMIQHWQGPDWAFLSEAREPGMSLSSLMAHRGTLNPVEVALLMRQIHAGLEQALDTGAQRVDLDPANIQLCVGYDGPVLTRDLERLHQKRLDVWPKCMVKLRLHKTMRSLCRPRMIDLGLGDFGFAQETDLIAAREERQRSLVCLAAYLLAGEGQMRRIAEFPISVPPAAASYLYECLQSVHGGGALPTTADFTEKLCQLLTIISADTTEEDTSVPVGEMENAGFVSDFNEDWPALETTTEQPPVEPRHTPVAPRIKPFEFYQRPVRPASHFPWVALSSTILLLGALGWMILGDFSTAGSKKIAKAPITSEAEMLAGRKPAAETVPELTADAARTALPTPVTHQLPDEKTTLTAAPSPPKRVESPSLVSDIKPDTLAAAGQPANDSAEKTAVISSSSPQLVTTQNPAPSPPEVVTIRHAVPLTAAEKEAATPHSVSAAPPPTAPEPSSSVSTSAEPKLVMSAPIQAASSTSAATVPSSSDSVTIRPAIVLSPEEIRQAMKPQANPKKRRTSRR